MTNNHTIPQPRASNRFIYLAALVPVVLLLNSYFSIFSMSSSEIKNVIIVGVS